MEYIPSYKDDLYLEHHGIKGQKWGVRRYQNPDGSLTPAGKAKIKSASEVGASIGALGGGVAGLFVPGLPLTGMTVGSSLGAYAGQEVGKAIGKGITSGKLNKQLAKKVGKGAAITAGLLAGSYGAMVLSEEVKASQDFKKARDLTDTLVSKHLSDLSPVQQQSARDILNDNNNRILSGQRTRKAKAQQAMRNDAKEAFLNPKTASSEKRSKFREDRRGGHYRVRTGNFNDIGFINDENFSNYEEGIRRRVGALK